MVDVFRQGSGYRLFVGLVMTDLVGGLNQPLVDG
jgi:hypothetical protein